MPNKEPGTDLSWEEILREFGAPAESTQESDTIRLDTGAIRAAVEEEAPDERKAVLEEDLESTLKLPRLEELPNHSQRKVSTDANTIRLPSLSEVRVYEDEEELPDVLPQLMAEEAPTPQPQPEPVPPPQPTKSPKPPKAPKAPKAPKPKAPVPPVQEAPEKMAMHAAKGLTGAYVRLAFAAVFALASAAITILSAMGILRLGEDGTLLPFLQCALLLLCGLMTFDVVVEGLLRLFRLRLDPYALTAFGFVLTLIDGGTSVVQGRGSYSAVSCLALCASLWGMCMERQDLLRSIKLLRHSSTVSSLRREAGFHEAADGLVTAPGDTAQHLEKQKNGGICQTILTVYSVIVLLASLVLALVFTKGDGRFLQYWTALMMVGSPLLLPLVLRRPWSRLSRRLQGTAAVSGWQGVKGLSGKYMVPVSDEELCPADQIQLNGVKFYGDHTPDHVISCATAVILASGSMLGSIFEELRSSRGARNYKAEELHRYDGGLTAQVGVDSVMLGSANFLKSMGAELPAEAKVSQAVYVALNNELCGVFALNFGKTRGIGEALSALARTRGITPVIATRDFFLTEEFLQSKFKLPGNKLQYLDQPQPPADPDARQCALLARGDLVTVTRVILGGRGLRVSVWICTVLAVLSGLLGLGMVALVAYMGATEVLSGVNVLLYALVWSVPIWLFSGWASGI